MNLDWCMAVWFDASVVEGCLNLHSWWQRVWNTVEESSPVRAVEAEYRMSKQLWMRSLPLPDFST